MVITTVPDRETAEGLVTGILENRLAACIQIADTRSFFLWEGKMQKENEVALHIKTTEVCYENLEHYIKKCHPYRVPEIIKIPIIGGFPGYLDWIYSVSGTPHSSE